LAHYVRNGFGDATFTGRDAQTARECMNAGICGRVEASPSTTIKVKSGRVSLQMAAQ
jgi:hypothetical protein